MYINTHIYTSYMHSNITYMFIYPYIARNKLCCIYAYVYIYRYMYMYLYIKLFIHTYVYIYVYMYIHVCMHIYPYINKYKNNSICVYTHILYRHTYRIYSYVYVFIYIYVYVWVYTYIMQTYIQNIFLCKYVYIYIYIYTLIYIQLSIYNPTSNQNMKNRCLYCNRAFGDLDAVRKHMKDKAHCKVNFEDDDGVIFFGVFSTCLFGLRDCAQ